MLTGKAMSEQEDQGRGRGARREAFHRRLQEAVRRRGLSQAELARRLSVRRATVGEWLNHGRLPSGATMIELPRLLEVHADWLLLGRGERDL